LIEILIQIPTGKINRIRVGKKKITNSVFLRKKEKRNKMIKTLTLHSNDTTPRFNKMNPTLRTTPPKKKAGRAAGHMSISCGLLQLLRPALSLSVLPQTPSHAPS
jgi:hypothetical protein